MNSGEPIYSHSECAIKPIDGKTGQGIVYWRSDYSIVSKKPVKAGGEKGIAVMRRDIRDTSAGHRAGAQMTTKLMSLTQRAKGNPEYKFTTLAYLLTEDFLLSCFWELKRDKATGIDGVKVEEYEVNIEEKLKDLVARLKSKRYKPQPVRRVYIPKVNGKLRGLGIPTVEDKIVQMGIKKILEAIYEADFVDVSYGFRHKRSCHGAINAVDKIIMTKPINYIVDMDVDKFFDSIDHEKLIACLRRRIRDKSLLRLIVRFLRAGVMEEGKITATEEGTPQGGVMSPILANIYLHYVLDKWFDEVIKKSIKGYAELVRYADDFVVCYEKEREVQAFGAMLKARLKKFGLKIAEGKSRIIEFGRCVWQKVKRVATFDFLGFTHYCDKSRYGKFKISSKTAKAKFRQKAKAINEWLKKVRNAKPLREWWKIIQIKLAGHYRYYGISGNMRELRRFYILVSKLAYKWINRRSQKKSFTYKQYCRFIKYNPLPKPKIYHLTYTLSS